MTTIRITSWKQCSQLVNHWILTAADNCLVIKVFKSEKRTEFPVWFCMEPTISQLVPKTDRKTLKAIVESETGNWGLCYFLLYMFDVSKQEHKLYIWATLHRQKFSSGESNGGLMLLTLSQSHPYVSCSEHVQIQVMQNEVFVTGPTCLKIMKVYSWSGRNWNGFIMLCRYELWYFVT